MWNTRCEILHKEDELTLEKRIREEAKDTYRVIRENPWIIRQSDNHLFEFQKEEFFDKSSVASVKFWHKQIKLAMKVAKEVAKSSNNRITRFLSGGQKRRKNISDIRFSKLIPSQVLWPRKKNVKVGSKISTVKRVRGNSASSKIKKMIQ